MTMVVSVVIMVVPPPGRVLVKIVVKIVVVATLQTAPFMVLLSNVTAPVCARARPFKLAPVFKVMLASARISPMNVVPEPRVAELPTCHHTLHGSPPSTLEWMR